MDFELKDKRKAMKKILFASTALASLAIGGAASAEIALFGSARLGLGYNIRNNGTVDLETTKQQTRAVNTGTTIIIDPATGDAVEVDVIEDQTVDVRQEGTEDFRAISRVRWGATMTGESDSGITFGATIRADNASGGGTGASSATGQTDGNVFVSGAWGTLTFGDTNGADEQHVGDAGGNLSVTGLGDFNETPFISNGGGFGDDSINFANDPNARPTVRYDYNFAGFGVSASTNRELNDIGVGASYTADFDGGSVTAGVGYYDFQQFQTRLIGGGIAEVKGGEQWSVGLTGNFGGFSGGAVYTAASSDSDNDLASGDFDVLNLGMGYTWNEWGFSAYYADIMTANGNLDVYDGKQSYGVGLAYDLGGGASVNMGVAQTFGRDKASTPFTDNGDGTFTRNTDFVSEIVDATVADFGITMAF
jgi:outer membrane protein OmpU